MYTYFPLLINSFLECTCMSYTKLDIYNFCFTVCFENISLWIISREYTCIAKIFVLKFRIRTDRNIGIYALQECLSILLGIPQMLDGWVKISLMTRLGVLYYTVCLHIVGCSACYAIVRLLMYGSVRATGNKVSRRMLAPAVQAPRTLLHV